MKYFTKPFIEECAGKIDWDFEHTWDVNPPQCPIMEAFTKKVYAKWYWDTVYYDYSWKIIRRYDLSHHWELY